MKRKLLTLIICSMFLTMMLSLSTHVTTAQFIISEWESDDGYGQGIISLHPYENSTGVWLPIHYLDGDPLYIIEPEDETTITMNYTENTALRFAIRYTLNKTFVGASSDTEGLNVIKGGVSMSAFGTVIYSEENLTMYILGSGSEIYTYVAYATIPVIIQTGLIYVISFTYEIYPYLYE